MEEILGKIFNRIFGNWTGLRLAVENAYGGPSGAQVRTNLKNDDIHICFELVISNDCSSFFDIYVFC